MMRTMQTPMKTTTNAVLATKLEIELTNNGITHETRASHSIFFDTQIMSLN